VPFGCAVAGDWLELSGNGLIESASMTGFVRALALYAIPRSRMNLVGECVCRERRWLSEPRGESAPPSTTMLDETAFSAS
jgi:hypothetical protein